VEKEGILPKQKGHEDQPSPLSFSAQPIHREPVSCSINSSNH